MENSHSPLLASQAVKHSGPTAYSDQKMEKAGGKNNAGSLNSLNTNWSGVSKLKEEKKHTESHLHEWGY